MEMTTNMNKIYIYMISCMIQGMLIRVSCFRGTGKYVCENEVLDVTCHPGQMVVFQAAEYGNTQLREVCGYQDQSKRCPPVPTLSVLNKKCFGQEKCQIKVGIEMFADPCPGIFKYLYVNYVCAPYEKLINVCDHRNAILDQWGFLVSPNYPQPYFPSLRCNIVIPIPAKHITNVWVVDVEVEARSTKGCYDWLTLSEKKKYPIRHEYCGTVNTVTEPFKIALRNMTLKFKTDRMNQFRGFLISFNTTKDTSLTTPPKPTPQVEVLNKVEEIKSKNEPQNNVAEIKPNDEPQNKVAEIKSNNEPEKKVAETKSDSKHQDIEKKPNVDSQQPQTEKGQGPPQQPGCNKKSLLSQLPPYSVIEKLKNGKLAKLVCRKSFRMKDPDEGIFVCYKNIWVGIPGKCLPEGCGSLADIAYGRALVTDIQQGSQAVYECDPGYVVYGETFRTCLETGEWSGSPPACVSEKEISHLRTRNRETLPNIEIPLAIIFTVLYFTYKKRLSRLLFRAWIKR